MSDWTIDPGCIACDASRQWAPGLIGAGPDGRSRIVRQPRGDAEVAAMRRAAQACPVRVIHNGPTTAPAFPFKLATGVFALGGNSPKSYGGHSYLAVRPQGNLLIDSPTYSSALAERVAAMGGVAHVLLTHRDDVADAQRWAQRFDSRVWIHEADAAAAAFATDVVQGESPQQVSPGVVVRPTPGHTRGSVVFHVDDRSIFTGDTLHWNRRRGHLDVFPRHTWYSWDRLGTSILLLKGLRARSVYPGHGQWRDVGFDGYREQLTRLAEALRTVGRADWEAVAWEAA